MHLSDIRPVMTPTVAGQQCRRRYQIEPFAPRHITTVMLPKWIRSEALQFIPGIGPSFDSIVLAGLARHGVELAHTQVASHRGGDLYQRGIEVKRVRIRLARTTWETLSAMARGLQVSRSYLLAHLLTLVFFESNRAAVVPTTNVSDPIADFISEAVPEVRISVLASANGCRGTLYVRKPGIRDLPYHLQLRLRLWRAIPHIYKPPIWFSEIYEP